MAQDYMKYLAVNVLNEERLVGCSMVQRRWRLTALNQVTYRALSRALKIHGNLAKKYEKNSFRTERNA